VLTPKNIDDYDSFSTADGYTLTGYYTYDIRAIPYGTPVRFYSNGRIVGLFYCDNVERLGKDRFQINCVSAVGLMDKQRHTGDVYTGKRFDALIAEIIGDDFAYEIEPDVAELQVFGWLPYGTKRSSLHQLLVGHGVNLSKSDLGGLLFTFLKDTDSHEIPSSRIFMGGSVQYGDPASRVEVLEHGFHYLSNVEYEVLFDTRGDAVENTVVVFKNPVYADSLTVEEGSALEIIEYGTNYAVVSGVGVLLGKPYVHTIKRLVAENEEAATEKVVTVEDATLITMANSENCLKRISEFYFNATTVKNDIIVNDEKTGRRYLFENAFHERTHAFMRKMSTRASSFLRAECEYITDYTPVAQGQAFLKRDILELTEEGAVWNVPDSVYEKDVPQIRAVLIGAGYDGEDGQAGADGEPGNDYDGGEGGAGGMGGNGGKGGKIFSVTINASNLAFLSYGKSGENTWLRAGDAYYTSGSGISSPTGFIELFTGAVFGLPGNAGASGAPGGKGGSYPPIAQLGTANTKAQPGTDLEFNGVKYKGGKGANREIVHGADVGIHENMHIYFGGSGGGGAAPGAAGKDGATGTWQDPSNPEANESGWVLAPGGDGGDALEAQPTLELYGSGGNGGSGGGGGGGACNLHWWNHAYTTLISMVSADVKPGKGGKPSKGTAGYRGCVILYY
jgi:hypothetical protein